MNEKTYDNLHNEGGYGYNPNRREYTDTEVKTIHDGIKSRRDAEWNLETTKNRRADWNAFAQTLTGAVNANVVRDQERKQGWKIEDLKAAVQRHGL